jgi:hypothetical protein
MRHESIHLSPATGRPHVSRVTASPDDFTWTPVSNCNKTHVPVTLDLRSRYSHSPIRSVHQAFSSAKPKTRSTVITQAQRCGTATPCWAILMWYLLPKTEHNEGREIACPLCPNLRTIVWPRKRRAAHNVTGRLGVLAGTQL